MGDSLYVGSCNGVFRELNARSGKVNWETNVRGNASQYFFHGDVFTAPDRIVASTDVDASTGAEAGLHAFDRNSGRHLWKYSLGRGVLGTVVGSARRVFAYTATGDLIALNLESGTREWSYALNAAAWESPAVIGDRVFAGSKDGTVYAFDGEAGRVDWQRKLGAPVGTSIGATASEVYVGTADGTMYRLAPSDGEVRSSLKIESVLQLTSAPVLTNDAVLVLLVDENANYRGVVSVDPAQGRIRWRQAAPDRWSTSRTFATTRTVLVGTPSGDVTAYCAADGSLAWTHRLANAPVRSIGGTDETLFVGTPSGLLYAIRPPRTCR